MARTKRSAAAKWLNKVRREAKHIPVIGENLGRLGRVADILYTPCAATPSLFVSFLATAPDALMFAFTTLFKPTWTDAAVAKFSKGHRRAVNNRNAEGTRGIDMYKNLGSAGVVATHTASNGLQAGMLTGVQLGRAAGWYLTLAEASTSGLVKWVSGAYQMNGCAVPPAKAMSATLAPNSVILFEGVWLPFTPWVVTQRIGYEPTWFFDGTWNINQNADYTVSFSATAEPVPGTGSDNASFEFRLRFFFADGRDEYSEPYTKALPGGGSSTHTWRRQDYVFGGPILVQCQYRMIGGSYGKMISASFYYSEQESQFNLSPDP